MLKPSALLVETIAVDEFCQRENVTPDFVKIDAEGAEFEILQGMKSTLSRLKPIVSVEVGGKFGPRNSSNIFGLLHHFGYQAFTVINGRVVPKTDIHIEEYQNLLFRCDENPE